MCAEDGGVCVQCRKVKKRQVDEGMPLQKAWHRHVTAVTGKAVAWQAGEEL